MARERPLYSSFDGIPRRRRSGRRGYGGSVPTLRRARRAQGYGRGLRSAHGERFGTARGAQLQDDNQGAARAVGLAGWRGLYPCRDGGDRRLLEAGVACLKRRGFHAGGGERGACQERAGAQDRRKRCHLARRSSGARPDPEQFRAGRPNPGNAHLAAHRKQLVRECSRHVQRLQKTLEDANIKLDSVISDIVGLSGRRMIEALIAGDTEPGALAAMAHRRIKATPDELEAALRGRVTRHHRFLLQLHLQQIDAVNAAIDQIDQEVDAYVEPFRATVRLLTTIPGIDELSACVILAEIGRDMSRFPTAGHLISWAGLCPKNDESAGKRRSTRMRKGAPWLKTTLVQCAAAAARKKASYLQAQFHRLRARRGAK